MNVTQPQELQGPRSPDPYLGPFLLGTVVTAISFGILCLQCFNFLQQSRRMRRSDRARVLIVLIWLLSALNVFSATWSCYLFMVTFFGNLASGVLGPIPWSVPTIIICSALSNSVVQGWFAWSIWSNFGKSRSLAVVLFLGVLTTCGFILAQGAKVAAIGQFALLHSVDWLLYTGTALDFVVNLFVTGAMGLYLSRTRRSPLYRWDYLVTGPVIYMSHTGVLCLATAFLVILIRVVRPNDFIYFGIFIPYSTMYANALVGFLNSGVIPDDPAAKPRSQHTLRGLSVLGSPAKPSSEHVIGSDLRHALDVGIESQELGDLPLAVRVETVVEKDKRMMVL
ncbi:hypothetical protein PsYK624_054810 [Phanerochaete sordida]|uniref:DUF6534 domain-containing protein n=1 Tax=Phanerochaete sordida TaxID=48140 RepID=A0A9P3LBD8_9APHY|nr:hypothetical protein PsYK624_054810 [Phanerochaete sordida]